MDIKHENIAKTLCRLRPGAAWFLDEKNNITWLDKEQSEPSEQEITDNYNSYIPPVIVPIEERVKTLEERLNNGDKTT